jgi:hypothetical protein
MDKQTKLLLGLGLIGVGGYLLWKQGQMKPTTASYTGNVGRRMRFNGPKPKVGLGLGRKRKGKKNMAMMAGKKNMMMMAGGTVEAHQSTFNANGGAFSHGGFFDVKDSGWQGFTGGPGFFSVKDSGWQGFTGEANMMVKDSGWQG